jgi:hypothetical protein
VKSVTTYCHNDCTGYDRSVKTALHETVKQVKRKSVGKNIERLREIRRSFGRTFAKERQGLLESIANSTIKTASDTKRLHDCLCFARAFPDNREIHEIACSWLQDFESVVSRLSKRERTMLSDSGIAGTDLYYAFSYEVAGWMARYFPGIASVDWPELEDTDRLDALLGHLIESSEADYFDSGWVDAREWLEIATADQSGTPFDWLMMQASERKQHARFLASLYNAAEIPLCCELSRTVLSRSGNTLVVDDTYCRSGAMKSRVSFAKREICRKVNRIKKLGATEGQRLVNVAMRSLAVRHRETAHFNYANPGDVYLADVGRGVSIAVTGLAPEHRYPLECTLGFLLLSNGVPIGYGGASVIFNQANTGINIFDEYRGSEAAWLWVQVMRVFHTLCGCNRFIANPYQFGGDNSEALKSGAFWFYYRLGYRPVDSAIRKLARQEFVRLQGSKEYKSPVSLLRRLATCDMHLVLAGARQSELFDESWIESCSLLATQEIARTGELSRKKALRTISRRTMKDLGLRSIKSWPRNEQEAFVRLCPIVAAADPGTWSTGEKKALVRIMRAKGGKSEVDYARHLRAHERLFLALKRKCRHSAQLMVF